MSQVRMCDKCGILFPEGAEGTSTGQITAMVKDPRTGRTYPETRNADFCAGCTNGTNQLAPRVPISIMGGSTTGDGEANFLDVTEVQTDR